MLQMNLLKEKTAVDKILTVFLRIVFNVCKKSLNLGGFHLFIFPIYL